VLALYPTGRTGATVNLTKEPKTSRSEVTAIRCTLRSALPRTYHSFNIKKSAFFPRSVLCFISRVWELRAVVYLKLLTVVVKNQCTFCAIGNEFLNIIEVTFGTAVAQWLRCCATNRKVAGSIPDGVIGIFHWHNPSSHTMALGSTQPLTEMSTRSIAQG